MSIKLDHIYRANQILIEMLRDRGSNIEENIFISGLSLDNFRILAKSFNNASQFNFMVDGKEVHFHFFRKKKSKDINKKDITNYIKVHQNSTILVIFKKNYREVVNF